ncbi:hypothetical protein SAMN05444420_101308 [Capnocytophaga granulosa]|uniref:Uncharacterized protein n=1 Tax=Capnocytophaga granulosa TaxID=45242 RepID=A0A1H2R2N4_9FLAO|nr:hypothetical protein HMPREF9331_00522 [Capnocytophaga granulosa ATCC 51502]SDW12959.1 hypothetical protein SAMN05444420_101308 [Capnocytophaga granulosa]SUX21601.1 Uncharacterised protein [Capnocytophaga granulosa]
MYQMCCQNPNNLTISKIQMVKTLFPFTHYRDKRF